MPTKGTQNLKKKYIIETFGCQMNVLDSERAAAQLQRYGYQETGDLGEADLILFNTCAVRERPTEKVFARIRQLRNQKKPEAWVGVMGCVAQAEGSYLMERAPEVRFVIGTQAVGRIGSFVREIEMGNTSIVDVRTPNQAVFDELLPEERKSGPVAYVTIMEGCDKFCTFCIVPFTRGRERSRSPELILAEMQRLSALGVKEVHLLGQNVNSYGMGRRIEHHQRSSFAGLLHLVAARSGIQRIKYTTSHPRDFNEDIVQAMESWPALCPWIHLPAQSGSDRILAAMNRGYTSGDYMRKVELIRRGRRDYSLTGDMIVGFPGETDADFQQTVRLVQEAEFDSLYIFKYSPRPHTVSSKWPDSVPDQLKTERLQELVEVQNKVQHRRWKRYLGQRVDVLVEGNSYKSIHHWSGHTTCHKVINFETSASNSVGLIVKVEVTKVNPHSLFGRHVELSATESMDFRGGLYGS